MPWVFPVAESIALPPGIFVLIILVALLLFALRRRVGAFIFGLVGCVGLYLFSITPVANLLILPLENDYPPYHQADQAKYVVVLGGGLVPVSPVKHGKPSPSPEFLTRLVYGAKIAALTGLPLIVSGGIVPSRPASESEAVVGKQTLEQLGIKERNVLVEEKSRNTWENAVRVEQSFHPKRVILVTSAFHMPRSVLAFERNGISVVPAPTDYLSDRVAYTYFDYFPNADALRISAIAIKEYFGYVYYRLFLFHVHA